MVSYQQKVPVIHGFIFLNGWYLNFIYVFQLTMLIRGNAFWYSFINWARAGIIAFFNSCFFSKLKKESVSYKLITG